MTRLETALTRLGEIVRKHGTEIDPRKKREELEATVGAYMEDHGVFQIRFWRSLTVYTFDLLRTHPKLRASILGGGDYYLSDKEAIKILTWLLEEK